MKQCNTCNVEKPLSEYYKLKISPDGKDYKCKQCRKAYSNQHYRNDIPAHKKRTAKYLENPKHRNKVRQQTEDWRVAKQGIYKIVDTTTNEVLYVGESSQMNGRISFHKTNTKNPNPKFKDYNFYKKLNKHYPNIDFVVVKETKRHKEEERYYIDIYKPLYNSFLVDKDI